MLNTAFPCDSGGGINPLKLPEFEYTGQSQTIIEEGKGWKIKLLTSGTFTLVSPAELRIDTFLVGGGGGGYGSGGGGGYTVNGVKTIEKGVDYEITIPSGGTEGFDGGTCTAFGLSSFGGKKGTVDSGGSGGSGGGGLSLVGSACSGGSNGSNGMGNDSSGGTGQGFSTREFGEADGELYSGGGGGHGVSAPGEGGAGGGGDGGAGKGIWIEPAKSATYYGGGGGGGNPGTSGSGYQGITIIRNYRKPHRGGVTN